MIESYSCKSERNYTQYCNAEVDRMLAAQSRELDKEKRKKIVWDIERLLVDDAARPSIMFGAAGNFWQPYVRNFTQHDNSQYNNLPIAPRIVRSRSACARSASTTTPPRATLISTAERFMRDRAFCRSG